MVTFRDVEKQFFIINNSKYVKLTGGSGDANSILCYGYVDNSAGLTYQTVAATVYVEGDYSIQDTVQCISLKIRANYVPHEEIIPVKNRALFKQYSYIVDRVNKFYNTDPERERCRAVSELDQFRHEVFPDDVQVLLLKKGVRPERIWVRTTKLRGRNERDIFFEGRILNVPNSDFGVTKNDTILCLVTIDDDDGSRLCIALLEDI